jgi:hypothetical protein
VIRTLVGAGPASEVGQASACRIAPEQALKFSVIRSYDRRLFSTPSLKSAGVPYKSSFLKRLLITASASPPSVLAAALQ